MNTPAASPPVPAGGGQRVASLHWMIWPAVAFVAVMVLFPFGYAFWLSLHDYKIGQTLTFVGAGNYRALAADEQFWNGLKLTFWLYLGALAVQLVLGVALGLLLNRSFTTVQELNKYRKELARELPANLAGAGAVSAKPA